MVKALRIFVTASLFLLVAISFGHTFRSEGGTVLINEQAAFTLKSSLDGYSPSERALLIVNTLADGKIELPLKIKSARVGTWLYAGSTKVVRVTPAEAKAQGSAVGNVVALWKQSIEEAFALPPIKAIETSISIGPKTSKVVKLVGTEAQQATLTLATPGIASVEPVMGGMLVAAQGYGETAIIVRTPSSQVQVLVKVLPSAVKEIPEIVAEVFGDPAQANQVQSVVAAALLAGLKTAENARIEILSNTGKRMIPGATLSIPVKIRVAAPGTIPYVGIVHVKVKNLGVKDGGEEWDPAKKKGT